MRRQQIMRNTGLILAVAAATIAIAFTGATAFAQSELKDGEIEKVLVGKGQFVYYYVDVEDWNARFAAGIQPSSGNADIYVRQGALPTVDDWDFRLQKPGRRREIVLVNDKTSPTIESDRWYIGVYGVKNANVWVGARIFHDASQHSGMGSIPFEEGTMFRVWAPNADSVSVAGEFNNWSSTKGPLVDEGNGMWSVDYRDVQAGDQYKFVIRNGGQTLWKNDPQTEEVTNSIGNSVVFDPDYVWSDGSFVMKPWNELIIYEMHLGTFNDSPGGLPGDFDSAIDRLDYLQDLGITAVELLPVNEFPGDYSWGYNNSFPFAVESIYGGPYELKRFVNEAHQRGIAVLLDVVYNHLGPNDLDMWRFDGWGVGSWGGIYFYNDNRAITPWGDTRPDFGRAEVRQFFRDAIMRFANDFHVDGYRVDSVLNMRTWDGGDLPEGWSLLQWMNDEIDNSQPWKFMIAEDMQNNAWVTKDTNDGGAGFDSQWDAQFVHPIRGALITASDNDRNMFVVRDAITHRYNADAFERVVFTESHDEVANGKSRLPEEIWPGNADSYFSKKRSTLGAAIMLTTPAVPMLFQGQEFLEDEYFRDTDPVDWTKLTTFAGIQLMYKDLIKLRRNWDNTTNGLRGQNINVHHLNNSDKMMAYHRWDQGGAGDDVIVVLNFANTTQLDYTIGLPNSGTWKVRFNSDWVGYDDEFGDQFTADVTAVAGSKDGMNFKGSLDIAPYTAVILSQD